MRNIDEQTETNNEELATRWQRFWAALIDGLIISVVTIPVMYFTGGFDIMIEEQPSFGYVLFIGLVSIAIFVVINAKLLLQEGQTIGKKVLKIKIVDAQNTLPSKMHLIKRYAVYFFLRIIPIVGPILSLINIVIIFGKNKKCGHDYAGDTKVLKVNIEQ